MLSAANSVEDDSFSEMKAEHESVGRNLIYKEDILDADDTPKNLNKVMFNHHKKETKDFFFFLPLWGKKKKKKKHHLFSNDKGHSNESPKWEGIEY